MLNIDWFDFFGIPDDSQQQFILALLATLVVQFLYSIYLNVKLNNTNAAYDELKDSILHSNIEEDTETHDETNKKSSASPLSASKLLDYILIVGKLKQQKRTGWVDNLVEGAESVADHMYRMGLLSFVIADPKIDRSRVAMVGLVHDLAEAVVGDITPTKYSGVSKEDKHRREVEALNEIADLFSECPDKVEEIKQLWWEYEAQETKEGNIVKQFDKLEMIIQAYEYEVQQRVLLESFFKSTAKSFHHPEIVAIYEELLRRRAILHDQWRIEEKQNQIPFPTEKRRVSGNKA